MPLHGEALPDFPWDSLVPYRERAAAHPGGIVDLSVGTPVDPTPQVVTEALTVAAQSPGYPQTIGTPALREAMVDWWARRRGVVGLSVEHVLPTIGSKEAVALLPSMLRLGSGDAVLHPAAAYPTYDVGARLAGATPVPVDPTDPASWAQAVADAAQVAGRELRLALVWLNSPGNPDGSVLDVAQLRAALAVAREHGAVVISDECYAELAWQVAEVPSLLDPRALAAEGDRAGGGRTESQGTEGQGAEGEGAEGEGAEADPFAGVLALYSLSKQSNMAGYRAAMIAGDRALLARVREIRKHSGMIMPGPVQAAMVAALGDDAHVEAQRELYRARREALRAALPAAGLRVGEECVAGLYLWLTLDDDAASRSAGQGEPGTEDVWDCWDLVGALADRGILVAPGDFYGHAARRHVRLGLTGSDERVAQAAARLAEGPLL